MNDLTIDLSFEDLGLLLAALDSHLTHQLPGEEPADGPRTRTTQNLLLRVYRIEPGPLALSRDEAREAADALDAHLYWAISNPEDRSSGFVEWHDSRDLAYCHECESCEQLEARLRQLLTLPAPPAAAHGARLPARLPFRLGSA